MADDTPSFFSTSVPLEVLDDTRQLGHGQSRLIATETFRKCSISAKINDLRRCHFTDDRLGQDREACIIVFDLEFGSQVQGSSQRITDMSIELMFIEIEEDRSRESQVSARPLIVVPNPDLNCKATYPRQASGNREERIVVTTVGINARPEFKGISIGNSSMDRAVTRTEPFRAQLKSCPAGKMGTRLDLTENGLLLNGVPSRLRFAVLLQTDGLPFNATMKFTGNAKKFGIKVGGKKTMPIGSDYLWYRRGDGDFDGKEDADSEAFKEWVRSKTVNKWAQEVEYDFDE